jgi:O-antigen/teichoic acid export membrane protein
MRPDRSVWGRASAPFALFRKSRKTVAGLASSLAVWRRVSAPFALVRRSQLKQNIASGVLAAGLQALCNLIGYPIYIHYLGYEQYGTWLILATLIIFMQLGIAGIGPAVSQLIAEAYARNDYHQLRSYVTWTAILVAAATGLLTALSWAMSPLFVSLLSLHAVIQGSIHLIPLIALLAGYFLWVEIFASVLSGLGRIDQTNLVTALGQGLIVLVAFLLLRRGWGIPALIIGYFAGRAVVNAALILLIQRRFSGGLFVWGKLATNDLATVLRVSGSILGGTILTVFLGPFNKWIIAASLGVSHVPIYEIAFGASMQVRNIFEFGLRSLVPEISKLNATGSVQALARIRSVFRKCLFFSMLIGLPLYLAVGIFSDQIFALWLHRMLRPQQVGAFRILLLGSFISMLGTSAYYCLIGLQAVRCVFQSYVIQVGLNVILLTGTLVLLHQLSVFLVCAATTISIGTGSAYVMGALLGRLNTVSPNSRDECVTAEIA